MSDATSGSNPDPVAKVVTAAVAFLAAVLELFEDGPWSAAPDEASGPRIQHIRFDADDDETA